MNKEAYEKYLLAGEIASKARDYGATIIKHDVSLLDVAEKVESKIKKLGASISFPVNIAINNLAAHYSPRHDDKIVFKKGDLVKLDVGTHIDGYIADTAITLEVGTNIYSDIVKASSEGLNVAIENVKPGVKLSEIGKKVEKKISSYGFKPIENLTGHSLKRYVLHAGLSVPSVNDISNLSKLKVDDVVAIEPFATDGAGYVVSGKGSNIYICNKSFRSSLIRDKKSKLIYYKFKKKFNTLPFAQRWVEKHFKNSDIILKRLSLLGYLKHYPQLIEKKNGIVSQKEHTVIITENGCEVTT